VGYLVGHHHGEAFFVLGDFEDAAIDGDLAAGEAPGVLHGRDDEGELPVEARVIGHLGDALTDAADEGCLGAGADDLVGLFAEDVAVGVGAELRLVFLRKGDALGAAGDGDGLLFGAAVEEECEATRMARRSRPRRSRRSAFLDGDGADWRCMEVW